MKKPTDHYINTQERRERMESKIVTVIIFETVLMIVFFVKYIKYRVTAEAMVEYNIKNNIPFSEEEYAECCRKVFKKMFKAK